MTLTGLCCCTGIVLCVEVDRLGAIISVVMTFGFNGMTPVARNADMILLAVSVFVWASAYTAKKFVLSTV